MFNILSHITQRSHCNHILGKYNKLAIAAMFQSLEKLAREKQCAAVHTRVSGFNPGGLKERFFDSLLDNGHAIDHLVLCKTLEQTK